MKLQTSPKEFRVWSYEDEWWLNDDVLLDKKGRVVVLEFEGYAEINKKCVPVFYTGLKDKNGKKVFEGDIVRLAGYDNQVIVWNDVGHFYGLFALTASDWKEKCVVIGNMFENPELLQGASKALLEGE